MTETIGSRPIADVRADFPILERSIRGKQLAYLDNAATSQKPRAVLEAVRVFYENHNANVHRSLHTLGEESTAALEDSRGKVQRFINAEKPREIVFTRGTTEAINLVAFSWGERNLGIGDLVLLTEMEHHSNLVPWQLLCARKGCRLGFIPVEKDGGLDTDSMMRRWDERTRLFALTHVSNVLGTVNDVKKLANHAHDRGAVVLVDAAQAAPHVRVDVRDLDCDFLAFSGHKAYGPMGIGVLFGRERLLEEMPPWMGGGEMISSVRPQSSTWNELPYKFEAGTPNVEGAVGLAAAIDYLHSLGLRNVAAREDELAKYAARRFAEVPDLTVYGSAPCREAIFSFTMGNIHAHDLAQFLDREGIAVRAGHHCAQPLMRKLGIPAASRASLCFYNTIGEIDRLVAGLSAAAEFYA
jgi:cysteine desulfurase/selenocysteine lyase